MWQKVQRFGIPLLINCDIVSAVPPSEQSEALKESLKDKKRPLVMIVDDMRVDGVQFVKVIQQVFDIDDVESAMHDVLGVQCWGRCGWVPQSIIGAFIGAPILQFEETFVRTHPHIPLPSHARLKWRCWFVQTPSGLMTIN